MYRTVICKNDDCRKPFDQSYHCQTETSGDVVMFRMLGSFDLRCPACGTLHSYIDKDLKTEMRDHPPDTQNHDTKG